MDLGNEDVKDKLPYFSLGNIGKSFEEKDIILIGELCEEKVLELFYLRTNCLQFFCITRSQNKVDELQECEEGFGSFAVFEFDANGDRSKDLHDVLAGEEYHWEVLEESTQEPEEIFNHVRVLNEGIGRGKDTKSRLY